MRQRAVIAMIAVLTVLASLAPATAGRARPGEVLARRDGIVVRRDQGFGPPGPPPPPQVILTGNQSATVDFTTPRELRIRPGDVEVQLEQITLGDWRPYGASVAGYTIRTLPGGKLVSWAVRVPEMGLWVGQDDAPAKLPRGRYRFGLIANGPAIVTLRGTGGKTPIRLNPTKPGGFSGGHVALSPLPYSPGGVGRVPVAIGKKFDVGFTALIWYGVGAGAAYYRHCLAPVNQVCENDPNDVVDGAELLTDAGYHIKFQMQFHKPSPVITGARDAVFHVATTTAATHHGVALFI